MAVNSEAKAPGRAAQPLTEYQSWSNRTWAITSIVLMTPFWALMVVSFGFPGFAPSWLDRPLWSDLAFIPGCSLPFLWWFIDPGFACSVPDAGVGTICINAIGLAWWSFIFAGFSGYAARRHPLGRTAFLIFVASMLMLLFLSLFTPEYARAVR